MNRHPLRPITEEDVERFREDGAICVRNVLDREWCQRMNAAVERLLLKPGKRAREATKAGDPGRFHMNVFMWRWDPDYRFLSWECDAGDVICHHPLVVHGAGGNASSSRRAAISIRYAGSDARWDPRPNVMKIEGEPENKLRAGDPLVLDGVFPITWARARAQV